MAPKPVAEAAASVAKAANTSAAMDSANAAPNSTGAATAAKSGAPPPAKATAATVEATAASPTSAKRRRFVTSPAAANAQPQLIKLEDITADSKLRFNVEARVSFVSISSAYHWAKNSYRPTCS
eukprot:6321020-Amphidinium_carterae.3